MFMLMFMGSYVSSKRREEKRREEKRREESERESDGKDSRQMSRWKCYSSSLLPFDNRFCVLRWAARRLEVSVSMSESAPAVTKKFCLKTKNQKSKIKIKMSVPSVTP